jgi:UrcA family protein
MRTFLLPLAALATVMSAPVAAQDLVVQYKDLDLSTKKGRKTLEVRIKAAATNYCMTGQQVTGSRIRSAAAQECYRTASEAAREQMDLIVSRAQRGG